MQTRALLSGLLPYIPISQGMSRTAPLGRGCVSQGMSRTADAFDCPSLAVMTSLVSSASSSPGFEDFSAPFLKYAYPGDEKDNSHV